MDAQEILTLSIIAKPGSHFASYDLLQAISATGMRFGAMNIFHYYDKDKSVLFSLASATKPGDFNLDKMGEFTCGGLTLFMDLSRLLEPLNTFKRMLEVAEQLADDLDGELRASPYIPWNDSVLTQYQEKIFRCQPVKTV